MGLHFDKSRAYPRECGGTGWRDNPIFSGEGLSPRVRGNQTQPKVFRRICGPIPASAGEP